MTARFAELAGYVEQDTRTVDEIIVDIFERAGLRAEDDECI